MIQICCAQYTIKGTVLTEQQEPLEGVTITVGKNLLNTVTDSSGNYSFPFSSTHIGLSFSHVGYETVLINISGEKVPTIALLKSDQFLSEAVVNAFESNRSIKNIPAAVAVLNRASLERFGNESLVPAINTVPGVKMDERSPGSYRLSIRGNLLRSTFGVRNVKVYWNGIPLTDANGNTYINELALNNIGKIEILKGPSGSMYGSGTGGVVLLKSNLVSTKEKSISINSNVGIYGSFNANIAFNQSDKRQISTLSVSHQQSDGYRTHTNMRRDVSNFAGSYFISAKQILSVHILYADLFYQTPGALTLAEMLKNPRQSRPAAGAFNSAEAQKAAIYLKTWYAGVANEIRFNSKWENTTAFYLSATNFKNPSIRNYEIKTERGIGVRTVTKYKNNLFTGIFGVEYQYAFTNTSTYGNKLGERDSLQFTDKIDARQYNIFLQTDFNLMENFILNAGVSYNNFYYGFLRANNPSAIKEGSNFNPQLIPRISLLKKIRNRINVYAAVSKGYSPPSIDEVHAGDGNFNKQLKAETTLNYEAGMKADMLQQKLSIDISYYIAGLKNTIVSRRDASGGDYFVNAGKTKQQGFEAALKYMPVNNSNKPIRQLNAWVNYTNIYARFSNYIRGTSNFDGNRLTGTSPNILVCGTDVNSSVGIYTNITYSYTDHIPLNDANSFYANAYHLFFAKLGYKVNFGNWLAADFFFAYNKSFNTPYSLGNDLNASADRYFNPATPQNLMVGFKFKCKVR